MGGSGGRYFPSNPTRLRELIDQSGDTEFQQRLDSDVNQMLQGKLATFNNRNVDQINGHLDRMAQVLGKEVEVDRLLLGGSVAKHTYVDGLSDIDALVVLDKADLRDKTAQDVLDYFHERLSQSLPKDQVQSVDKGDIAVTVNYQDGTQIQLLPAVKSGNDVAICDKQSGWCQISPGTFQNKLTETNQRFDNQIVPAIKLIKAIIAGLPEPKQLSGYHIEALTVEAVKDYNGPRTLKAMIPFILEESSKIVNRPIVDVTGQSTNVDSYLGKAHSTDRRIASDALAALARKLNAASSVDQWENLLQ